MHTVLLELGSLRVSIGRHSAPAPPPPSLVDVDKALPAGARISRDLSEDAARLTSGAPATGDPPNPGPLPVATDTPRTPIRFQYPQGYNQTQSPGRGKLTPFGILRQLADVSDVTRICIETRKDQIDGLEWAIVARDKRVQSSASTERRIAEATAFFAKPDKRRDLKTWIRMACEEIFVIDALSVYRRRTRGGQLYALEIKDGATILPLLDETGDTPLPPAIAYRQVIQGVPVEGGDCTVEQLYYRPRTARVHTPYGLSPTEAVLLTVNAALQRSTFNLAYYSEGNIPRGLMSTPEGWTADQIEKFQTMWDEVLVGNLKGKSRVRFVGHGMAESFKEYVDPDFSTQFDEFLLKVNCAAFGVTPTELGFTADVNKATSQGQENITYRRGVRPLTLFFQQLFDEVLTNDLGLPDLQFRFQGGEPEDRMMQARIDKIYWDIGKVSTDELRQRDGQDLVGVGPMIWTSKGPIPIESLLHEKPDANPNTTEITPPKAAGSSADDTEDDPATLDEDAQKELRAWKTVALKALKAGQRPRAFTSLALPAETVADVQVGLLKATTPKDVAALFAGLPAPSWAQDIPITKREYKVFTGAARVAQARLRRYFADAFVAEGEALTAHLEAALQDDTTKVQKALTAETLLAILDAFPWEAWAAEHLAAGFFAIYRDLVVRTAQATVVSQNSVWNPKDPFLAEFMTGYVGQRITQLQGTTKARVIAVLRRVLDQGTPLSAVELGKVVFDAVRTVFDGYARWRANTIARTETAYAVNHGTLLGYHQAGLTHAEVYDGVDDDEACKLANGQIWTIRYALDHAIEHPNCVRTFGPHVPKTPTPVPQETA